MSGTFQTDAAVQPLPVTISCPMYSTSNVSYVVKC